VVPIVLGLLLLLVEGTVELEEGPIFLPIIPPVPVGLVVDELFEFCVLEIPVVSEGDGLNLLLSSFLLNELELFPVLLLLTLVSLLKFLVSGASDFFSYTGGPLTIAAAGGAERFLLKLVFLDIFSEIVIAAEVTLGLDDSTSLGSL